MRARGLQEARRSRVAAGPLLSAGDGFAVASPVGMLLFTPLNDRGFGAPGGRGPTNWEDEEKPGGERGVFREELIRMRVRPVGGEYLSKLFR